MATAIWNSNLKPVEKEVLARLKSLGSESCLTSHEIASGTRAGATSVMKALISLKGLGIIHEGPEDEETKVMCEINYARLSDFAVDSGAPIASSNLTGASKKVLIRLKEIGEEDCISCQEIAEGTRISAEGVLSIVRALFAQGLLIIDKAPESVLTEIRYAIDYGAVALRVNHPAETKPQALDDNPIYYCPITQDRKFLLIILNDLGGEPVSVTRLSQMASINEDDVKDLLQSLELLGLIEIDRHAAPGEWTLPNGYKVKGEAIQAWADQAGEMA